MDIRSLAVIVREAKLRTASHKVFWTWTESLAVGTRCNKSTEKDVIREDSNHGEIGISFY